MSEYVNFFLRTEPGKFYPLGSFSRNSMLFQACRECGCPYEKLRVLSKEALGEIKEELHNTVEKARQSIKSCNDKKTLVATFNNTTDEKLMAIGDLDDDIEGLKEMESEGSYAISFMSFLDEINFEMKYCGDDDKESDGDFIYFGIEVGHPTEEDIES